MRFEIFEDEEEEEDLLKISFKWKKEKVLEKRLKLKKGKVRVELLDEDEDEEILKRKLREIKWDYFFEFEKENNCEKENKKKILKVFKVVVLMKGKLLE